MENNYFFILGRNKTLAIGELEARLGQIITARYCIKDAYIINVKEPLAIAELQKSLGGTVKIGKIFSQRPKSATSQIIELIRSRHTGKKINFGINDYGCGLNPLHIKKALKENNISSRLVTSKDKFLSSVVSQKEILDKNGVEIYCFNSGGGAMLGQTLSCQPFEELSARDWGRPAKDQISGMLPPKLGMIMINLCQAKKTGVLLDPFCGSGTILAEAAIMGYEKIIGRDISAKAIEDAKKNISWLKENKLIENNIRIDIGVADVGRLEKNFSPDSIDAIATEPFLGPPLKKSSKREDSLNTAGELEGLYIKAFQSFKNILKQFGKAVIILPVFMHRPPIYLDIVEKIEGLGFKLINPVEQSPCQTIELNARGAIEYSRPGQLVAREIFVFEKL